DSFEQMSQQNLESEANRVNYERRRFVELMNLTGEVRGLEAVFKRRDGQSVFVRENARLTRTPDGAPLYYEGTLEDVTERRLAEEAHLESRALFDSIVNSLPQNIFCKDPEGRFTFGNKRFCEIVGMSLDQLVGKSDYDLFPHELAEKYREDDLRALSGE